MPAKRWSNKVSELMMRLPLVVLVISTILGVVGCRQLRRTGPEEAASVISQEGLLAHIRALASDEFEGRLPGTRGEELTVNYLIDQFRRLGLEPGMPDGSWVQEVPLVGYQSNTQFELLARGRRLSWSPVEDYVAASRRFVPDISVENSEIVFVGYGVVAPEYQWNDYKDVDVRGKTLLMLINDPPVPDPKDPSKLDPALFRGPAMTYYGRWTYKYEIASAKGAAAALIVHETGPAGYPWQVVQRSWGGENFDVDRPDGNRDRVPVEGWISEARARELFGQCGLNFEELKRAAVRRDFRPVPLPARASFRVKNTLRRVRSRNVLAKLTGRDPKLRHEYVIVTAHWDHLGKDDKLQGDQVFNGAVDNASGVAMLLEIAKACKQLAPAPKRTILFIGLTAEEQGLLGAKHYAEHPPYPLQKTVAVINIDSANPWGRTRDIAVVGWGNSTLDELVQQVATQQGRVVKPDPEPEKGFFYRADHFEFAKQGVPALYTHTGTDYIGKPPDFGKRKREEFTAKHYHQPSDEIQPDWDLSGAVEDARLLFQVVYELANRPQWPEWKPGAEFKAKREAMLRGSE